MYDDDNETEKDPLGETKIDQDGHVHNKNKQSNNNIINNAIII